MLGEEAPSAAFAHRRSERRFRPFAADGEHDPLETAAGVEMAPHLLDLDSRRLLQGKAPDAGAEGDQGEALGAEPIGLRERVRGRLPDDLRGGGAAELHGRGVDDPAARHLARRGLDGFAEPDRRALVALGLHRRAARAGDRARDATAVPELRVGGVRDRVDLEARDVRLLDLDLGHRGEAIAGARPGGAPLTSMWTSGSAAGTWTSWPPSCGGA